MQETIPDERIEREHFMVGAYLNLRSATLWLDGMKKEADYRAKGYKFYLGTPNPEEIPLRIVQNPDSPVGIWVSVPKRGIE